MQAVRDFPRQEIVHHTMPLDPVLAAKRVRHDPHAHMRRLAGNMPFVPDMLAAFVDHFDLLRRQGSGKRITNSFDGVHKITRLPILYAVSQDRKKSKDRPLPCFAATGHTYRAMKFDSPLFDKIRVKPEKDRSRKSDTPVCEWPGCKKPGGHRAPKGRGNEKTYWNYCLQHVREYNHKYNYFEGMSNDDIASHQKDALTGHRPTWKMNARTARTAEQRRTDG